EQTHHHGALLAVDNTFASPVNQQPLSLGADLVVHSATKYLGGHSDITAGAVMGSADLIGPIWGWRKSLGQILDPRTAALLARSLRTLGVRVRQQNASSLTIARAMEEHPRVRRVLHPGLDSFPGHALASRQMSGFGGMLSIEIAGSGEEATAFVDRLELFAIAPSLGGAESLVTQPVTSTHHDLSPQDRARRGITENLVRLSIGLEDPGDLLADLEQALS
ncbi:MAG: PLP-dependent transferase, partial [Myxococcota bacterium]|nr:PLP-dependent transferase [Myxococcota bacterium]